MKLLTIITSHDLEKKVEDIIAELESTDCYVSFPGAYGISMHCEGAVNESIPWDGTVIMITGEENDLVHLAEKIRKETASTEYKPCLRMMIQPVDRIWN